MAAGTGKKFYLLFLLAMVVVLGLILAYSDHGLMRLRELQQKKQAIEMENEKLQEENRRLLQQIERIKTDPRYIEDEARKKLGLIRPDETIYRLKEEPDVSGLDDSGS